MQATLFIPRDKAPSAFLRLAEAMNRVNAAPFGDWPRWSLRISGMSAGWTGDPENVVVVVGFAKVPENAGVVYFRGGVAVIPLNEWFGECDFNLLGVAPPMPAEVAA